MLWAGAVMTLLPMPPQRIADVLAACCVGVCINRHGGLRPVMAESAADTGVVGGVTTITCLVTSSINQGPECNPLQSTVSLIFKRLETLHFMACEFRYM